VCVVCMMPLYMCCMCQAARNLYYKGSKKPVLQRQQETCTRKAARNLYYKGSKKPVLQRQQETCQAARNLY